MPAHAPRFSRSVKAVCLSSLAITLCGCASTGYVGTWSSAQPEAAGSFQLGGMTLAPDGTYTAFADYGGTTRGFSGTWSIDADQLVFENPRPGAQPVRYDADLQGDSLTVTDSSSGTVTELQRID
ncbi:MAG: hypothetical protein AAF747_05615 [Planctomycetota bacterium]